MQRDPRIYLQDVLDASEKIERFLRGVEEDEFSSNDQVQSAVFYQFAIVGEALNKLSMARPEIASKIFWTSRLGKFSKYPHSRLPPGCTRFGLKICKC
jgi:uncharacterized protein with HEPN domain